MHRTWMCSAINLFNILLSLTIISVWPTAIRADQTNFRVGTFTKITTTGSQSVTHNLNAVPKALVFWTVGSTSVGAWEQNINYAFGIVDESKTGFAVSNKSIHTSSTYSSGRRIAAVPLTFISDDGATVLAEASISAWDTNSFTVNWSTNTSSTNFLINYLAISGTDVSSKVVNWELPGNNTGNVTVSGIGFKPDVVLHFNCGYSCGTGAFPINSTYAAQGMGIMDGSGNQWMNYTYQKDGSTEKRRGQQTNHIEGECTSTTSSYTKTAAYYAMTTNGFIANVDDNGTSNPTEMQSLALKGINVKVGNFTKTTVAGNQIISGMTFQPGAVFFATTNRATSTVTTTDGARLTLGTAHGISNTVASHFGEYYLSAGKIHSAHTIQKSDKVLLISDTAADTPAIDAEASLASFNTDGMTLNWTTNNSALTEITYLALGAQNLSAATIKTFTASSANPGTLIRWESGYEIDNLGYHLYREENGSRVRLTPQLIAGSAFLVGNGQPLTAGQSYSWFDQTSYPVGKIRYWLEDINIRGESSWHGPIYVLSDQPRHSILSPINLNAPTEKKPQSWPLMRYAFWPTKEQLSAGPWPPQSVAIKILVDREGFYHLSQRELIDAGLDPQIDPRLFRLFADGKEVSLIVNGERDGKFDPADSIEFYGLGFDTSWTQVRTYWLVVAKEPGLRVREALHPISQNQNYITSFSHTIERRDRSIYSPAIKNGETANFFGPLINHTEVIQSIILDRPAESAAANPARLIIKLQGISQIDELSPDHLIQVKINEKAVGIIRFDGQDTGLLDTLISPSWIKEGENLVSLQSIGSNLSDVILVDSIQLTYSRQGYADNDQLRFLVDNFAPIYLKGFSSPQVRLFDVTNAAAPILLRGDINSEDDGRFSIRAAAKDTAGRRILLALNDKRLQKPLSIYRVAPTNLRNHSLGADIVMITHSRFMASLEPLKALREQQGHRVKIINIDEIYDEFGLGHKSAQAIRDFLDYARRYWSLAPRYVLLVGDASYDPRNFQGLGNGDLLPTKLISTSVLETASDDWFVDFDDNFIPDIAIGRLPVRTENEAQLVVKKIINHAQSTDNREKTAYSLFIAGDDSVNKVNFAELSQQSRAVLPARFFSKMIFKLPGEDDLFHSQINAGLSEDAMLINYWGHGASDLSLNGYLTSAKARGLFSAAQRLPIYLSMTCLNGFFHNPAKESLAEALLLAENGGAVAVWASSGLTTPLAQAHLNREMIKQFLVDNRPLGDAAISAKQAVLDKDVQRTWILLGDPLLIKQNPSSTFIPSDYANLESAGCTINAQPKITSSFLLLIICSLFFVARRFIA